MNSRDRLSRRSFLVSAAAVGGGLALGFQLPNGAADASGAPTEVNVWIEIAPDDGVVIRLARAEMGQGLITSLPMLVAEELECDWAKVRPEFVTPNENLRRNRAWGDMSTSASRSVFSSQDVLRRAGATAREMLVAAAAARWDVPANECVAAIGVITHRPSGRTLRFGEIAGAAARCEPAEVRLKRPSEWKLIGKPQRRFDVRSKINGEAIYGIDVRIPGMLYAAIAHSPVFGGTPASFDDAKIAAMPGFRCVVKLPDAVAVVADSWWRAKQAMQALPVIWNDGAHRNVSSATIRSMLEQALNAPDGRAGRTSGDAAAALASAATRVEADYTVPFLAHATMEPQNCTAHVTADRVEIWAPSQDAETALATAADAAGLPRDKVVVHRTVLGGGFGRRGPIQEYVRQAVLVAKAAGAPVKLIWTREEDIQHGFFRPISMARLRAGLDGDGMPVALSVRIAAQSMVASIAPEMTRGMLDLNLFQGLLDDMPYDLPNVTIEHVLRSTPVPVGPWRSVNHSQNAFYKESFIDEMAHAAGQDPYLFRRKLLGRSPRHIAALDAAARRANWGTPAPKGLFRGIALHETTGSICAQVMEVSIDEKGAVCVHRVISAIDAGHVVNPLTIEQQTEGAVVFALTAALYGEITIADGRVTQSNFNDYGMLRIADAPIVETITMPATGLPDDNWGGVGEPPLPPVAPALCNAIFAATGKRIRSLPLKHHDLRS